jgi:hypothetical protein
VVLAGLVLAVAALGLARALRAESSGDGCEGTCQVTAVMEVEFQSVASR